MPAPPPCKRLGQQCQELTVTVRISDLQDDSATLQDASATWLTGHTERITWSEPYTNDEYLMVDATLHVPCRYLESNGVGARCSVHEFRGRRPTSTKTPERPNYQLGKEKFSLIQNGKRADLKLPFEEPEAGSLPVIQEENPCAGAPCRTADNAKGAACCRDLTLELDVPARQKRVELLLRSRKSPYVSKIKREDHDTMECEVISACGYLDPQDNVSCTLHGRVRPNGRTAKPSLCSEWPELEEDETGHPGCVFC